MLELGTFAAGVFVDFTQTPWSTDANKFNHHIIISKPFKDRYGLEQTEVVRIEVRNPDDIAVVRSQVMSMKDKHVICPLRYQLNKGQKGQWLSITFPKDGRMHLLSDIVKVEKSPTSTAAKISVA